MEREQARAADKGEDLRSQAYAAFDAGQLSTAVVLFDQLLQGQPQDADLHYMKALALKYLAEWEGSLHHNQRAQALYGEFDEATAWNTGIAATALGQWAQAREAWAQCGISISDGNGPTAGDYGTVSIRLNPWGQGETLWAHRIDVVRARLLNVPLPDSGHRLFDIVLHDGASTGQRTDGNGRSVPVFNALATLEQSPYRTFVVFVRCEAPSDLDELMSASAEEVGYVEDWTDSIVNFCLRCSYGAAHRHDQEPPADTWQQDRDIGIGATRKEAVEQVLQRWVHAGSNREVISVAEADTAPPAREETSAWWSHQDNDT